MLTFQVIGHIGRIELLQDGTLRVAISTGDLWVLCDCRDKCLCERIRRKLRSGNRVKFSGAIVPKLRADLGRYEMQFIVSRFTRPQ